MFYLLYFLFLNFSFSLQKSFFKCFILFCIQQYLCIWHCHRHQVIPLNKIYDILFPSKSLDHSPLLNSNITVPRAPVAPKSSHTSIKCFILLKRIGDTPLLSRLEREPAVTAISAYSFTLGLFLLGRCRSLRTKWANASPSSLRGNKDLY